MIALQWFRAADPARSAAVLPEGYKEREVRTLVRLRADGSFIDLRVLPAKEPRTVALPFTQRSSGYYADVVDNYEYVFGAGAPGREPSEALARGAAYREHLRRFDHPATRAILRFLETAPPVVPLGDTDPAVIAAVASAPRHVGNVPQNHAAKAALKKPEWLGFWACTLDGARQQAGRPDAAPIYTEDVPRGFVLFEVEGHPGWWMDSVFREAKREARTASQGDVRGRCSLCYREDRPLARLLDVTSLSKGPSISSFNIESATAFNRSQNYTAPTCQECAGQMVRGFNAIVETPHVAKMTPAAVYHALLWWDATLTVPLWAAFDVALDANQPREERLAALDRIPAESYFLDVRQNERRLAFLRHAYVTRNAVCARLRRAISVDLDFNRAVKALCAVGSGADRDPNNQGNASKDKRLAVVWREALLIDLIGGEPLGARDLRIIQEAASAAVKPFHRTALRALILYLQGDPDMAQPSTPEEVAAYALGRAIAHVDRIQYRNSQSATPHSATMLRRVRVQPAHVRAEVVGKAWYRVKSASGKRLTQDRHVLRFYAESRDLPERRLTLREFTALQDGFVAEREHIFATFKRAPAGTEDVESESESESTSEPVATAK